MAFDDSDIESDADITVSQNKHSRLDSSLAQSTKRKPAAVDWSDSMVRRFSTFDLNDDSSEENGEEMNQSKMTVVYDVMKSAEERSGSFNSRVSDEGYCSQSLRSDTHQDSIQKVSAVNDSVVSSDFIWSVYSQDADGDNLLHVSIIQADVERSLYYISLAPSQEWLNIFNTNRQTALHLAVVVKLRPVVRRLMTSGARVDVRDSNGNTPLHIACRKGDAEMVRCLLNPVHYEETLVNQYDIPYQRIPQDPDIRNYDGLSCLHLAALEDHVQVLELLLKRGAKINSKDRKSGRTVLHYAAEMGNEKLVEFLLRQRKIDINCCTYGGDTPVSLAAGRGNSDIVRCLMQNGADCSNLRVRESDTSEDEDVMDVEDDLEIDAESVSSDI